MPTKKPNLLCVGCPISNPIVQKVKGKPPEDFRAIPAHILGEWVRSGAFKKMSLRAVHNEAANVGKILEAVQAKDGSVVIKFEIDRSNPMGDMVADMVEKKQLKGLSIGHRVRNLPNGEREYVPVEVTICGAGAREDTVIISVLNADGSRDCKTEANDNLSTSSADSSVAVMCSRLEQMNGDRSLEWLANGLCYDGTYVIRARV